MISRMSDEPLLTKLRELWREVDALGGTSRNEFEVGYSNGVEQALLKLEAAGFRENESSAADALERLSAEIARARAETADVRRAANAEIDCLSRASQREIESWQTERNCARMDQEAAEARLAEWIAYADKLEGVLEIVAGETKDKLKASQAQALPARPVLVE